MTPVAGLDALRGLAILGVFLFHGSLIALLDLGHRSLFATLGASFGWIGVDLFFAISGFLITRIVLDNRQSPNFYGAFWFRRGLRILPAYYALLAIMLLGWPALVDAFAFDQAKKEIPSLSYWLFMSNTFMASTADHGYKPLSVTWSLCIEVQFYLLWPLLARRLSTRALWLTILGLLGFAFVARIALLSAGYDEIVAYVVLPFRSDGLLAGALIACLLAERRPLPPAPLLWGGVLVAGGLLGAGLLSGINLIYETPALISLKYSLVGVLCFGLVALTLTEGRLARILSFGSLLPSIGKYSYAIYLCHYTTLLVIAETLFDGQGAGNTLTGFTLLLIAGLLASSAVALLSRIAIEGPALRLKKLVPYGSLAQRPVSGD